MIRKMQRRIKIRIDMTPMVDVIILLLIFFFMTATFKEPDAVEVRLPYAAAGLRIPKDIDIVSVIIDAEGVVYVNNVPIQAQGEVTEKVKEARIESPGAIFNVRSDADAEYGVMVQVMKELQQANVIRFNLETQKEEGAW
ncbi:MAG: biopolymer transporter ExbD [Candidatus Coatesbacteria bacterium]|nr:MAG: biopolymer transporter ExbD [Candidatus Coatesbacteria bacterium]